MSGRVSVSEGTALKALRKYIPYLLQNMGVMIIPPLKFPIDLGFGSLMASINDGEIKMSPNVPRKDMQLSFDAPNYLNLTIKGLSGKGKFNLNYQYFFFSETYKTTFDLIYLNVVSKMKIKKVMYTDQEVPPNSPFYKGKYIPDFEVESMEINYDFDFTLEFSILNALSTLIKQPVKNYIKTFMTSLIKKQLMQIAHDSFHNVLLNIGLIPNLTSNLYLDLTMSSDPYVYVNEDDKENPIKRFIYDSVFLVFDSGYEESMKPKYEMDEYLPEFMETEYETVGFLGNYALLSAFNTILLDETVKHDLDGSSSEFINTNYMDEVVFYGLIDKLGANRVMKLGIMGKPPASNAKIFKNGVSINFNSKISFYVQNKPESSEDWMLFAEIECKLLLKANQISLFPYGYLYIQLDSVSIDDKSENVKVNIIVDGITFADDFISSINAIFNLAIVPINKQLSSPIYLLDWPDINQNCISNNLGLALDSGSIIVQLNPTFIPFEDPNTECTIPRLSEAKDQKFTRADL